MSTKTNSSFISLKIWLLVIFALVLISSIDFIKPSNQLMPDQPFEERKTWLKDHAAEVETAKLQILGLKDEYLAAATEYEQTRSNGEANVWLYPKYGKKLVKILEPIKNPYSLSVIALWAQHEDPWLNNSKYPVFFDAFAISLNNLGKSKQPGAADQLHNIERSIKQNGHFDGHIAEMIEEAEDKQEPSRWDLKLLRTFL